MGLGQGERVLALASCGALVLGALLVVLLAASGLTPSGPSVIRGDAEFTAANAVIGGNRTPWGPIVIRSDMEFTAGNGVSGGNGTEADPYRIEGLEITCCAVGIYIENTDAWFVIRDVLVAAAITGIHFFSLANGTIEDATISGREHGIRMQGSRNVGILRNTFVAGIYGSLLSGIDVSGSDDLMVANNSFSDLAYSGLALSYARRATVVGNRFNSTGIGLYGPSLDHVNTHTITPDNLVNGKPIRYHRDCTGLDIDGLSVGQLLVANCTAVRVTNLAIEGTNDGVVLAFVDDAAVNGNNVSLSDHGMRLVSVSNTTVQNNSFFGNSETGVTLSTTAFVRVANNAIVGGTVGVGVSYSVSNTTIVGNEIGGARDTGVLVYSAHDVLVTRNNLTGNGFGVGVWMGSSAIRVYHNNFRANLHRAYDEPGSEVAWIDGYPSGGNFWDDYLGVDLCSGPNQDVCPPPDGIGDTPHPVDSDSMDRYALMEPFSGGPPQPPPDSNPPLTTADAAGTAGLAGWYRSSVIVTLSATDSGSGVSSTTYRVDGGAWATYAAPFSVGPDGHHTVEYYSTDVAGNAEPPQSLEVLVDATPPHATATFSGTAGNGGWFVTVVSASIAAIDATSQVASIQYRLDGGPVQAYAAPVLIGTGQHALAFWATDAAGNAEAPRTLVVRVDTAPPEFQGTSPSGVVTQRDVFITWSATDALSGIDRFEVSVDGGAYEDVGRAEGVALSLPDGVHRIRVRAVDSAGNVRETEVVFTVDTNPFSPSGPYAGVPTYALVVAGVGGAIAYLWIRRRGQPKA